MSRYEQIQLGILFNINWGCEMKAGNELIL